MPKKHPGPRLALQAVAGGEISRLKREDQEMLEPLLLRYHPKPHHVSKRFGGLASPRNQGDDDLLDVSP